MVSSSTNYWSLEELTNVYIKSYPERAKNHGRKLSVHKNLMIFNVLSGGALRAS
jgi:hypothetical protein